MSACDVTALTTTSVTAQYYNVYTPQIQFSHTDFVQTPDCLYTLVYTYEIEDLATGTVTPLPSFVT